MATDHTGVVPGAGSRTRRRADAERSITAIVEAALVAFRSDADATMADIARTAGVGRVTLYSHFPSREELLEEVMARAIEDVRAVLAAVPVEGPPARDALAGVVRSCWQVLDRYRSLHAAAVRVLGPERMRARHDEPLATIGALVERGQHDGTIRADLPRDWLVATVYSLLHAAASETEAGRLSPGDAAGVLEATVVSALSPAPAAG
ncbi:TetR/AcrR family transcriptional regulator [Planomonospora sp. ID67723]|uniref:TetR/AcrR family transcriptional regulator n=1 Tax=Planomonospora sp. ID67723 TaxID=2738134 RepID=UPI0018C397FA|nr:TetR/AcrR family transcriptional regulator [Planomonospora sp. ID67723]MBG0830215.1 TetR/AcrR family transcriptional regulator [Planomonospora sp. ID67723]